MTGNHDMGVVATDLKPFTSDGKNIQIVSPDWYNTRHQGRRLEHGHYVDMFNAPDRSSDTIGNYPLGFFITRLVATAADQSAVWQALKALLESFGVTYTAMGTGAVTVSSMGSFLVEAIITLLEGLAEVGDKTSIRFSEPALDNRFTVGDVKTHYGSLFNTWAARYPNPAEFVDAMLVSLRQDGLDWYASKVLSGTAPPKVMIMGHTHHMESESKYCNSGCWCIPSALSHGDATPSYVLIDGDKATLVPWDPQA